MEIELVFTADGQAGQTVYYTHPRCLAILERELLGVFGRVSAARERPASHP
jgi:hypothetical protein